MKPFIELLKPINVPDALAAVEAVFADAIESGKHQPGDWRDLGVAGNLQHLADHVEAYRAGRTDENHALHIICRGLCLVQLLIESHRPTES